MKQIFFFLLLFFIITTIPINASEIQSILQKSVGGKKAVERIRSLKSIYMSGTVNMNGVLGTFEYKSKLPDKFHLALKFPSFSMEQGYDGTTAWQQDLTGQKTELTGTEKNEVIKTIYLNSYKYLFDDTIPNKNYLGKSYVGEKIYEQILFFPTIRDTIHAFFDVTTGNRTISKSKQDLFEVVSYDSLFQTVDDINFPFYSQSVIKEMNFTFYQLVDSVLFDVDFPDSIFLFQKRNDANYRFPAKNKLTIKIEFQNNHIFVPVTISGTRKVYMLLDSGAGASIINKKIADEIIFDSIGTMPAIGVSGTARTKLIRTDSMQIGDLKLYKQIAGSMDLQNIMRRKINKVEFGGILGNDFLSQFPILIDYQKKELTIYNPKNHQAQSGGNKINFEYYMLIPTIECKVGSAKGTFIVDLGNSFGLILHDNFVKEHNLKEIITIDIESKQLIGGIGGASVGQTAVVDSFLIGDEILLDEKVTILSPGEGIVGSTEIAGNIGNRLLKKYKVYLNFSKNEIILYKYE